MIGWAAICEEVQAQEAEALALDDEDTVAPCVLLTLLQPAGREAVVSSFSVQPAFCIGASSQLIMDAAELRAETPACRESVLKVPIEFGSDLFQAYSIPLLSLSERASGLC